MQLQKHHWRIMRNTPKFTQPVSGSSNFRNRNGGVKSFEQNQEQIRSREMNPQDPINRN